MPSLADIEHEIENILAVADELGEDRQPAALEYLDGLALDEAEKVDSISYVIRRRKGQIQWIKEEESRLRQRRHSMECRLESFREYLVGLMSGLGITRLRGHVGSLSLRPVRSMEVTDLSRLPASFKETVIEERVRKREIREALAAGEEIDGARLMERTTLAVR